MGGDRAREKAVIRIDAALTPRDLLPAIERMWALSAQKVLDL